MVSNINPQLLLNRHNYFSWAKNIRRILETEGLVDWLKKESWPSFEDLKEVEKFKLNQSKTKAAGLLKTYCTPEIELEINHLGDPLEIWTNLKASLETPGRSFKAYCLTQFLNIRKGPDEELPNFIARFEEMYRQVENAAETVSENQRCYMLVHALSEDYDYLAREFEKYEDGNFTFVNLKEEILSEYNRRTFRELQRQESLAVDKNVSKELGTTPHEVKGIGDVKFLIKEGVKITEINLTLSIPV